MTVRDLINALEEIAVNDGADSVDDLTVYYADYEMGDVPVTGIDIETAAGETLVIVR